MYNNAYNQLNSNHYNQIIQNQFIPYINQNYGNNYLNQQQNYNINNLYTINQNQLNNQIQIQNFKNLNNNYPYYYQNNHYIPNNNIQFNNNNNTHQNNINHYKQHNHNQNLTIHHPNQFTIKKNNEKNNIYKDKIHIKEECDTNHAKLIPENINDKLYNSIVKIILNNGIKATGFFMKIKINREIKCLFTCKHVIGQNDFNNKININLYYGKKDKENYRQIKLDRNIRFMKVFDEDVTLIEIIENDKISEDKYLDVDLNYQHGYDKYKDKDKNFYLAGYPKDYNTRSISSGKIQEIISDYEFSHTLDTKEGSSGSPICNENGDVIGIHTSGDEKNKINYGIFIGKIIDTLKNQSIVNNNKNYIIAELYINDKNINENIRIINSFEQVKREYSNIEGDYKNENEKEIKENCVIKINGKVIPFNYFYKFKKEGIYKIEYSFNHYITNTNYMFFECSSLTNLNLSNFNTTNVIDMSFMFERCPSLTNLNLSNFNTTNVTNMSSMFDGCSSLTNLNLSNFNTTNVTDMSGMFSEASSLTNLNLSNFNTTNVTDMSFMFYKCSSLTNLNLSNFNTTNVTNMSCMFDGCSSLTNLNLSKMNEKYCLEMIKEFKNK